MHNISIVSKLNCCGCSACEQICPQKAISMITNHNGFKYPLINDSLCVKCGLCCNTCPSLSFGSSNPVKKAFVVRNLPNDEYLTSQSGGAFMMLANYVIEYGGYVIGCELIDNAEAKHNCYNSIEDVNRFKKSKYIQSDISGCFKKCEELLKNKNLVLFVGTGCQTRSIINYLKIKNIRRETLITCDIVCHGVCSPKVWKDYLSLIENKNNSQISSVIFRNKNYRGWHSHYETIVFKNGKQMHINNNFYSKELFRESCFSCKFTSVDRETDFTIGDCWGLEKTHPELDDNKGYSLVFVRNKGLDIFDEIQNNCFALEIDLFDYLQPQLSTPTTKPSNYDEWWEGYRVNPTKQMQNTFFPSFFFRLKRKLKRMIRK